MNYRKFYETKTGVIIPKRFDIHHIDLNRQNNDIYNLVALPKELHRDFHIHYSNLFRVDFENMLSEMCLPKSFLQSGILAFDYNLSLLDEYSKVRNLVGKWIDFRNHLLGLCPNVHELIY